MGQLQVHLFRILDAEKGEEKTEKKVEYIMAEVFLNLMQNVNPQ